MAMKLALETGYLEGPEVETANYAGPQSGSVEVVYFSNEYGRMCIPPESRHFPHSTQMHLTYIQYSTIRTGQNPNYSSIPS